MSEISVQRDYSITSHVLADDGVFPNNPSIPLQLFRPKLSGEFSASAFEALFDSNGWPPAWRSGIFDFHHYHSTAHEVLGCFSGSALLQFGGSVDLRLEVQVGDVVVIPAGVAHKCLSASRFRCVGGYPAGQSWDTCYGRPGERPAADQRILALGPLPGSPV